MQHARQAHLAIRLLTRINCLCWAPVRGHMLLLPALRCWSPVAPWVIYGHVGAGSCLQVGSFAAGHVCLG